MGVKVLPSSWGREPVKPELSPVERATDLPDGQKRAILMLRGGELARAVVAHLREMSAPGVTDDDLRALVAEGRVYKRGTRHYLTPRGVYAATDIAKDYARKFGIHHVTRTGSASQHHGLRCTCGWSAHLRYGGNPEGMAARATAEHLGAVKNGTWKEPEPIGSIMERVLRNMKGGGAGEAPTASATVAPPGSAADLSGRA